VGRLRDRQQHEDDEERERRQQEDGDRDPSGPRSRAGLRRAPMALLVLISVLQLPESDHWQAR